MFSITVGNLDAEVDYLIREKVHAVKLAHKLHVALKLPVTLANLALEKALASLKKQPLEGVRNW